MKQRKIPLRRCTGCLEMKNKKEMLRIVKSPEGEFFIDRTSKKSGRGAYCCPNEDCFLKAFKTKGLDRSFGTAVPQDVYDKLRNELDLG